MDQLEFDIKKLAFLHPQLLEKVLACSSIKTFEKGTEILSEEQYIKVLPIVIEGLVKVYSRFDDKELLLYYIEPSQSCVMTFCGIKKHPQQSVCNNGGKVKNPTYSGELFTQLAQRLSYI